MNTYSHFLLTSVLRKPLKTFSKRHATTLPALKTSALLIGSLLPDAALIIMAVIAITRDYFVGAINSFKQLFSTNSTATTETSWAMYLFDIAFFENPWVISLHNLFHSPLLLLLFISIAYWFWRHHYQQSRTQQKTTNQNHTSPATAAWFFWLGCAAMLHTLCDIPVHTTDGPLLLFPLDWEWRFISPVSYWDPRYYGKQWMLFEHGLDLLLLLYWLTYAIKRYFSKKPQQPL